METVIISERKKSLTTDLILIGIFCVIPLIFLIQWLISDAESRVFVIFLMMMTFIFPCVAISGYIWDVKQKLVLSENGIKLHYGRNIVNFFNGEKSFTLFPDKVILWNEITGFEISSYDSREAVEGGGYNTVTKYSLIIKIRNTDKAVFNFQEFKNNYYSVMLGKFEENPNKILEICENFQRQILKG